MALRLIEVFLPKDQKDRVQELLKNLRVLGGWQEELSEGKILTKLLLPAEQAGEVLDLLEKHFTTVEGFRIILLPVEASIPRPQEEASPEQKESPSDEKQEKRIGGLSREELYANVEATAYLAANNLVNSLAAGTAPVLGGKFADFFAGRELSWTLKYTGPGRELAIQTLNLQQWDFFFFLAFLIGLYSIHRLSMVKEIGEVEEKIVRQELISEVIHAMRSLSTAAGLRHMTQIPLLAVRRTFKKRS